MKHKSACLILLLAICCSLTLAQQPETKKPVQWAELTLLGYTYYTNRDSSIDAMMVIKRTGDYHVIAEALSEGVVKIIEKRGKLPEKVLERLNIALLESDPNVRGEEGFLTWRYMLDARTRYGPGVCVLLYHYIWATDVSGKKLEEEVDIKWLNQVSFGEYKKVFEEK